MPLPKHMTGQNQSNFEKIDLWQISNANGTTRFSIEPLVAKELVLVILGF